jgi:ankyrin repeat protein
MAAMPPPLPGQSFHQRYAIGRPADTSRVNEAASRLLLHATQQGDPVMVQSLLVEAGANPSFRNGLGESALHIAAARGVQSVMEALLRFGADPNIAAEHRYGGRTPLHVAVRKGDARMATCLLEFGADANVPDACGRLALHEAATLGDEACVRALLARGSVSSAEDMLGLTPADCAAKGFHKACVAAINEATQSRAISDDYGSSSATKHEDAAAKMLNHAAFAAKVAATDKRVVWKEKKAPPKKK